MTNKKARYFDHIHYNGYVIQPYSTRRCGKRDYMVMDKPKDQGGKKLHGGTFYYIGQARLYIDKLNGKEK